MTSATFSAARSTPRRPPGAPDGGRRRQVGKATAPTSGPAVGMRRPGQRPPVRHLDVHVRWLDGQRQRRGRREGGVRCVHDLPLDIPLLRAHRRVRRSRIAHLGELGVEALPCRSVPGLRRPQVGSGSSRCSTASVWACSIIASRCPTASRCSGVIAASCSSVGFAEYRPEFIPSRTCLMVGQSHRVSVRWWTPRGKGQSCTASSGRTACRAVWMRDLTVPSGTSSNRAISA